jgi:hypothetical protein
MNNYRVTFSYGDLDSLSHISYWNESKPLSKTYKTNFVDLPNLYWPIIEKILKEAKHYGIEYIWVHYEPHVEITWISENEETSKILYNYISNICTNYYIDNCKFYEPKDFHADWFCKSDDERVFGTKRMDICRQFIQAYNEHKKSVDEGCSLEGQIKRLIHTLCNPLGLNYMDEAKICFSRGLICLLFRYFGFSKAVWIYEKIFRQRYL